jgi:hypothetical protein
LTLSVVGGRFALSDATEADFALIAVDNKSSFNGYTHTVLRIRGEVIAALVVRHSIGRLVYADLHRLTSGTPKATQAAGISLLADNPLVVYGALEPAINLAGFFEYRELTTPPDVLKLIRHVRRTGNWPDERGSWAKSKVTGEHHTWFRPAEVIEASTKSRERLVAAMLTRLLNFSETEAFVSGMLLWASLADERLVELVCGSEILWSSAAIDDWLKVAKKLAGPLKTHHRYTDLPLEQLFEFFVLANRGIGEVDWHAEKTHRVNPNVVNVAPEKIKSIALAIFRRGQAEGYTYAEMSWDNYWARRWAHVPTGSMHSQYFSDMQFAGDERTTKTKHFMLSNTPKRKLRDYIDRRAEIKAWPSTKYEWAKMRAIYGCDVTTHLVTDFAMPAAEDALDNRFPVGNKANEEYVVRRVDLASAGGIPLCFDYEDFNSQHSLASMQAVVDAYFEVCDPMASQEQRNALAWTVSSVTHQGVEGKDPYTLSGTLLSGWRLTSFVNSVLNFAYLEAAGAMTDIRDSVHNGDDVLAFTTTLKDAVEVLRKAKTINIRAQPSKCAVGGLAEFLRMDRAAAKPTGAQYLTRAVATAVHARTESMEPDSPVTLARDMITRIQELKQRGANINVCERLYEIGLNNVARIFDAKAADLSVIRETHLAHGGLNDNPDVEPAHEIMRNREQWDEATIARFDKMPGVIDYARYLVENLELPSSFIAKATRELAKATADMVLMVRSALVVRAVEDVDIARNEQYLYRICKDEYAVSAYSGKARLAGAPIGKLPMKLVGGVAAARIACSKDPLRTMKLIF